MALDLTSIRQRLSATTPGEWEWPADHADYFTLVITTPEGNVRDIRFDYGDDDEAHVGDARFIASAAADIRALLDEVERLRALLPKAEDND